MTLNITEGCYVKLRNGAFMGPVERRGATWDGSYIWYVGSNMSWDKYGRYLAGEESQLDIIEALPGKPVFIDTPFEVGKRYRTRSGEERTVTGFALALGGASTRNLDGSFGLVFSPNDLLPGAIEDEEEVTVKMSKADYDRAMELLKGAKG